MEIISQATKIYGKKPISTHQEQLEPRPLFSQIQTANTKQTGWKDIQETHSIEYLQVFAIRDLYNSNTTFKGVRHVLKSIIFDIHKKSKHLLPKNLLPKTKYLLPQTTVQSTTSNDLSLITNNNKNNKNEKDYSTYSSNNNNTAISRFKDQMVINANPLKYSTNFNKEDITKTQLLDTIYNKLNHKELQTIINKTNCEKSNSQRFSELISPYFN